MKQVTYALMFLCVLTFGGCQASGGGYQADVGVSRERIKQDGATARARIQADVDAQQAGSRERLAPYWLAGLSVAGAAWFGAAWARRPHRPVPPQVLMLAAPHLEERPAARLEMVEGDWCVVDDERRELIPVARRLSG